MRPDVRLIRETYRQANEDELRCMVKTLLSLFSSVEEWHETVRCFAHVLSDSYTQDDDSVTLYDSDGVTVLAQYTLAEWITERATAVVVLNALSMLDSEGKCRMV